MLFCISCYEVLPNEAAWACLVWGVVSCGGANDTVAYGHLDAPLDKTTVFEVCSALLAKAARPMSPRWWSPRPQSAGASLCVSRVVDTG